MMCSNELLVLVTSVLTVVLLGDAEIRSQSDPPRQADAVAPLESLWADLSAADAAKAYRAIRALGAMPERAVALLRERVQPARVADLRPVAGYVRDLDSGQFAAREKAEAELARLGQQAETALREALAKDPSTEARRRIERLLEKLAGPVTNADRLRELRAVEVLESINTPEARALLKRLSEGAPGFLLTQEAKASLERLAKRPATMP
jgi:hypothetical protein